MIYSLSVDAEANINNNIFNITVTLSALSYLIKGVTRNLGGFFSPITSLFLSFPLGVILGALLGIRVSKWR